MRWVEEQAVGNVCGEGGRDGLRSVQWAVAWPQFSLRGGWRVGLWYDFEEERI